MVRLLEILSLIGMPYSGTLLNFGLNRKNSKNLKKILTKLKKEV